MIGRVTHALRLSADYWHDALRDWQYKLHGMVHDTVTINTRQGRLTMHTRDEGIGIELFRTRQFEYDASVRVLRFLKEHGLVPSTDLCMLDVGANIGLISTGLLLANEIDHAIAIEPEPHNFALLQKNIAQNGLASKVDCLPFAVGDHPQALTMELSTSNPGDHRIRSASPLGNPELYQERSRATVQVQSLPLPDIIALPEVVNGGASAPSLLWMDIQGYEGFVFRGAQEFLRQGIPTVSEIWPYAIRRSGMSLDEFVSIARSIWTDYWVDRRGRFVRYSMDAFDCYLAELGNEYYHENVIFTVR